MESREPKELVSLMTLEEKASLLSGGGQFSTRALPRLGIPSIYLSDGPHGLRKQAGTADHLGLNASLPATCFPTASAIANSWDTALGEELGKRLGEEAASQGVNVLLGPGLNIKRSPLCGRNFEYFSEDPYLAGKLAAAYIRGIQSQGVAACPKHFAANNQERLRMHSDSVLDERTLREIYLAAFEIAVQEGKPQAIMTSYNRINGIYANESTHLLQDILNKEWGFNGLVVTDWGGGNDRVAGLEAGNQLEMPATAGNSNLEIIEAVRSGLLAESLVDKRVEEYLRALFAITAPCPLSVSYSPEDRHGFARLAAEAGIVLLKNDDNILPLQRGTKIAVIGDFAETPRYQGAGSSMVNSTKLDTLLDSLGETGLGIAGYAKGFLRYGREDEALRRDALKLAASADTVLLCLGLDEISETEGLDRSHLAVNQNQIDLLNDIYGVNTNIVVVFSGGSPVETPWLDKCKAFINGYLGGQAGAAAMADALAGTVNPSGKLAESWPRSLADTPAAAQYPGMEKTAEYREGIFAGYRYYATAKAPTSFPFGFGLSYTTFAYSDLNAGVDGVSFSLSNTGDRAGAEIVQVYVSMGKSAVFRPLRELKGFARVFLRPGERKTVAVPLDDKAFRFFNVKSGKFEIEGGDYTIQIGASSEDIRLEAEIFVEGTMTAAPCKPEDLPAYYAGAVRNVGAEEFEKLLGRPLPQAEWDRSRPLELNDTFAQLVYAKSAVGRLGYALLTGIKNRAEARGKPDLNILYIYYMPFRGLAKMTAGAFNMEMAAAVVEIFNGHFFRGAGRLIKAWLGKNRALKKRSTVS